MMKPMIRLSLLSIGLLCVVGVGLSCIANPRLPRFPRPIPTGAMLRTSASLTTAVTSTQLMQPTDSAVRISGYTFSYPQEIPDNISGSLSLLGWFPNASDEIVVLSSDHLQILAIQVATGQIRALSERARFPLNPSLIHLLTQKRVAFVLPVDAQGHRVAQIVDGQAPQNRTVLTSTVYLYPIALPENNTVVFFNPQTKALLDEHGNLQRQLRSTNLMASALEPLSVSRYSDRQLGLYMTSPVTGTWSAFYNKEYLRLFNTATGEMKDLALSKLCGGDCFLHAEKIEGSPDGHKFAILGAEGYDPPYANTQLLLYDVSTQQLQQTPLAFRYVMDLAWAPDSEHILFLAYLKTWDNSSVCGLFLWSQQEQVQPVSILPDPALCISKGALRWSPDGKTVVIQYADESNPNRQKTYELYRVHVNP